MPAEIKEMMAEQWEIIGGPSREELFDAIRLQERGLEVTFFVCIPPNGPQPMKTKVFGIVAKEKDGESWFIEHDLLPSVFKRSSKSRILFNTRTRKGAMFYHPR